MPRKKVFWFMLLSLLILALSSTMAISQDKGQVPAEGPQKTLVGKIVYLEILRGLCGNHSGPSRGIQNHQRK